MAKDKSYAKNKMEQDILKLSAILDKVNDNTKTGSMVDILFAVIELKTIIADFSKITNLMQLKITNKLIERMEFDAVDRVESSRGSATKKINTFASVKDKEAFTRWVTRRGKFEMLQSRCSPAAVLEYFEEKNKLPDGIETYSQAVLNTRRKSS